MNAKFFAAKSDSPGYRVLGRIPLFRKLLRNKVLDEAIAKMVKDSETGHQFYLSQGKLSPVAVLERVIKKTGKAIKKGDFWAAEDLNSLGISLSYTYSINRNEALNIQLNSIERGMHSLGHDVVH